MSYPDAQFSQRTRQAPATSDRLQTIEAATQIKVIETIHFFKKWTLLEQASEMDRLMIRLQRSGQGYELPFAAARLKTVDHEKNGIQGTEWRRRTRRLPSGSRVLIRAGLSVRH
jgi:hypothetical protein